MLYVLNWLIRKSRAASEQETAWSYRRFAPTASASVEPIWTMAKATTVKIATIISARRSDEPRRCILARDSVFDICFTRRLLVNEWAARIQIAQRNFGFGRVSAVIAPRR